MIAISVFSSVLLPLREREEKMPKYSIEIDGECNRSVMFQPTQEKLRGRWRASRILGRQYHASLAKMPGEIPGIVLTVDTEARTCSRVDLLADETNKAVWDQINSVSKDHPELTPKSQPWPPVVYESCSHDTIKTWLYWMRRIVNNKQAVVCQNSELPNLAEVERFKGKIGVQQFNSMKTREMTKDEDANGAPKEDPFDLSEGKKPKA